MDKISIFAGACTGECERQLAESLRPFAIVALLVFFILFVLVVVVIVLFYRHKKRSNPAGWVAKKSGKFILITIGILVMILTTSGLYTYVDRQFTSKRTKAYDNCKNENLYLKNSEFRYTAEYDESISECNDLLRKKWGF